MNTLRNKVQLIGNLGQDPEVTNTTNGSKMARFSLATNEVYTNAKGEQVDNTTWHRIVAWGKTAEIIERYLIKGKEVAIEGKITNRTYTDKEGLEHFITEIHCNALLMLGK